MCIENMNWSSIVVCLLQIKILFIYVMQFDEIEMKCIHSLICSDHIHFKNVLRTKAHSRLFRWKQKSN